MEHDSSDKWKLLRSSMFPIAHQRQAETRIIIRVKLKLEWHLYYTGFGFTNNHLIKAKACA